MTKRDLTTRRTRNVPHPVEDKRGRSEPGRFEANKAKRTRLRGGLPTHDRNASAPKPPAILALYEDIAADELPEAVFGQYPRRLIGKMLPLLRCRRDELLHVCSGALPPGEGIRVDIRPAARPDILADGRSLPLASSSVAAVLIDPPYTRQYAKDLYGVEYPRPAHLLAEAARVVRPCGRIGFVHYLVPMPPAGCRHVKCLGLSTGFGFPMRAVTIYEKEQDRLL